MKRHLLLGLLLLLSACSEDLPDARNESPLASFLGYESYRVSEEERFVANHRQRQKTIVLCMKQHGFEYVPVELPPKNSTAAPESTGPEFGEWVEKYGFGISTLELPQSTVGTELVGNNDDAFESEFVDPNDSIVAGLDEASRSAYDQALYGQREGDSLQSGCIYSWRQDSGVQFAAQFGAPLEDLEEQLRSDPRITSLWDEAGDCVVKDGFQWFDPRSEDLHTYFGNRLAPISEELDASEHPDSSELQNSELSERAKQLLSEVQAEESLHALAYFDCGAFPAQIEANETHRQVRDEYETRFLDTNLDALELYRTDG